MADDQKRRELIFQMAMDMNRKNAREPHVTGQASMSQGDPPESKGLEDTVQIDDILSLMKLPVTAVGGAVAGKLGKELEKRSLKSSPMLKMMANPEHETIWMSDDFAKSLGKNKEPAWKEWMEADKTQVVPPPSAAAAYEKKWDDVFARANEQPVPKSGPHETIWMDSAFAKAMGKKSPTPDDEFFSGGKTQVTNMEPTNSMKKKPKKK